MSFGALEHLATESSAVLASSSRVPPPPPHQLGSPSGLLTDSSRPAAEAEAVVEAVAEEEEEERMEEEEEERMEELVYVLVDLQSQELAFEVDWRQATEALAGEQDVEMDVEMDAQPADPNTKAAMEAEEQADSQSQDSGSDSYYDTQDPFIDDSDIFGSGVAAKRPSTEIGGFFAQAGNAVVQIKAGDEEEAKTTSIKKKKRKRKPSTELNSSQKSESNVASPLGKVPKIDSSEMINMERQPGNSTLKILPEKAKEVFTAELSLAIQELVEHLSESILILLYMTVRNSFGIIFRFQSSL